MGLDWVVGGKPKPGYEEELRRLEHGPWDTSRSGWKQRAEARLGEISTGSYDTLGLPRVGIDEAATAHARWMYAQTKPKVSEKEWLRGMHGQFVPHLGPKCAGMPRYSNSAIGMGEVTTFRADFLKAAGGIIGDDLLERAWGSMWPPDLLRYGRALLRRAALTAQEAGRNLDALASVEVEGSLDQQLDIVRAAGEWCVFWAERGHGMIADF